MSFESQDLGTIEGLVAAGLGVALVPEELAGVSGTAGVQIAGAPGAHRTIGLTWRLDRRLPPAAERLRSSITAGRSEPTSPEASKVTRPRTSDPRRRRASKSRAV